MPCENCESQFTLFKRKLACQSCKRYYCNNCLVKKQISAKKKLICWKCEVFLKKPSPAKQDLMRMKTKVRRKPANNLFENNPTIFRI